MRPAAVKFVYSHSMYFPVLLAGFVFGIGGGVLAGLLGGIALGPFMPIDVTTGELQNTLNWLYRTGFFVLVGVVSGTASESARSYLRHLKWVALHDAGTQLPNRNALFDALSRMKKERRAANSSLLVVISLENVIELKSAFGFDVIEEIIRQSAWRYQDILPNKIPVYRIDTEQIALLVNWQAAEQVDALLRKLVDASQQPIGFNGIPIHADSRLGYVTFGKVEQAPETYLQRAESALIAAHENGLECVAYSPNISIIARENLSVLGNLTTAIEQGQLSLHYQPKVGFATGQVSSVEALMRWHHPERGNIPPAAFIPRAEQSTLIHLITEFALEQAMEQIVRWGKSGIELPVAVNISPRNLLHPGFSDLVLRLLQRYGVSGELLELEVTESALMTDLEHVIVELTRLADAKIILSIDDFGTGYSSLQYLHKLPISLIKIDQSFVRRLGTDKGAAHIVEAAVTLARRMGMKTIAEGVETEEVYDLLENLGCDIAQGFLISPALPAGDFEKWYKRRESSLYGVRS